MASIRPRYYVALDDGMSAEDARQALERLAEDDDFRERVRQNPSLLYEELGLEVGEGVIPEQVVLPLKRELREALEVLDNYEEFRFKVDPFGFYTPGKNPFIGVMLLAARANTGP